MRNAERGTGAGEGSSPTTGVAQALRTGGREASKRSSDFLKQLASWRATFKREAQERPVRAAAIALGAGYLLGGGLFSSLTARLVGTGVKIGMRLAVIPLVAQSIASVGDNLFSTGDSDAENGGGDLPQGRSENRNGRKHSEQKETNS